MKYVNSILAACSVIGLAGCASASKVMVQATLGPCHRVAEEGAKSGALQVYSARERALMDISAQEFFWNSDSGRNEFMYESGHTSYTILGQDGNVVQRVRNSRGLNDATPTLVQLSPGTYAVEAEAEQSGGITMTVVVPVIVEPGQTTTVHLEPTWKPSGETMDPTRVVQLADGRIIGCRFEHLVGQQLQSAAVSDASTDLAGEP